MYHVGTLKQMEIDNVVGKMNKQKKWKNYIMIKWRHALFVQKKS